MSRSPWRVLALVVALASVAAACSGKAHRGSTHPSPTTLTATSAGYVVPARLALAAPGTLIAASDAAAQASEVGAAQGWHVLYHSTDLGNRDIAVSGLVLTPHGSPPPGGWPVVAWAHGTSGLADQCAPSLAPDLAHDPTAVNEVRALLAQGWVVVASDYPGLGTPGVHTYLIGTADARAVVDAVSAAHTLLGARASATWVTVGHSEGGQTALFVAQIAHGRAPRWTFAGTVALAPASTLEALIPLAEAARDPVLQAYMIYALEGLGTVDPSVDVAKLLTAPARVVLPDLTTGCVDDITNDLARRHLDHLLVLGPAPEKRLNAELRRDDDPDRASSPEPILIVQGTADNDVPAVATDGMVTRLCALRDHLQYRHYPGLDHGQVVAASLSTVVPWIRSRFANEPTPNTCAPR